MFNIVAPFEGGWILDHLAQAVQAHSPAPIRRIPHGRGGTPAAVQAVIDSPPGTVGTIYAHHVPFHAALQHPDRDPGARDVLFFGHYYEGSARPDRPPIEELAPTLRSASRIWTNAACWDRWLAGHGVDPARISRIVRAVDSDHFTLRGEEDRRDRFTVGMVSQYHHRKNEAFMLNAIRRWPEVDFILLGRNWEDTPLRLAAELADAPNFRLINTRSVTFDQWPAIYRGFDAFFTASYCEGGPFPLLEAMAAGVWPLASRTGFAEDLIAQGETGHVFDIDDETGFDEGLEAARARAFDSREKLREVVLPWSWERFGRSAAADLAALMQTG